MPCTPSPIKGRWKRWICCLPLQPPGLGMQRRPLRGSRRRQTDLVGGQRPMIRARRNLSRLCDVVMSLIDLSVLSKYQPCMGSRSKDTLEPSPMSRACLCTRNPRVTRSGTWKMGASTTGISSGINKTRMFLPPSHTVLPDYFTLIPQ